MLIKPKSKITMWFLITFCFAGGIMLLWAAGLALLSFVFWELPSIGVSSVFGVFRFLIAVGAVIATVVLCNE